MLVYQIFFFRLFVGFIKISLVGNNQLCNYTPRFKKAKRLSFLNWSRLTIKTLRFINPPPQCRHCYQLSINYRYYFFHTGAALGNEIFYSIFFPCWFWNVDGAIARKITMVWGIFMYIGQATKDLMAMPRPASPPVVKLEERYVIRQLA